MNSSAAQCNPLLCAPVRPLIVRTALPGMLATLSSSASVLLDALLLARLGTQATAAAAACFPLLTLLQTIGFTLGTGAAVLVSRCVGSGEDMRAESARAAACSFALLLSAALCIPGFLLARPIVLLLGASPDAAASSALYARFVFAGGPMLCANLVLSSLLRGQGKTLPSLAAFGAGAAVAACMQLALIPRYGISGSGAAMLTREALALVILILFIKKDGSAAVLHPVHMRIPLAASGAAIAGVLRLGLPTLLRQGLTSVSSALLARAGAAFGDAVLGGVGLAARACSLVASAAIGFGQGFQPVCGAAFGAGRVDRVREAYRFSMRCVVLGLIPLGAAAFTFSRPLLAAMGAEAEIARAAAFALRAQSVVFPVQGTIIVMSMLTQALGQTGLASAVACSRQGFVLIPLLLILPQRFGAAGLMLSQSASDLLSLALCLLLMRRSSGCVTDSSCARA